MDQMDNDRAEWKNLAQTFAFKGAFEGVERLTIGHINDTYVFRFRLPGHGLRRYIVQRVNRKVFQKPWKVMENIQAVTEYLRRKIIQSGGDPKRETINLIPTTDGRTWIETSEGDFWRAYDFINDARTYETVSDPAYFRSAGKAFGRFQNMLSDFPIDRLHETIPQFHDTRKRLNDLNGAVERDVVNRAKDVQGEIEFVRQRGADASVIVDLLERNKLPLRVIHNDTKLNNVMIDNESGEGICVLDLDTVMPGSALYDFGDAIRFGASTAAEDETDLSKVWMDLKLFQQFTRGYLSSALHFLTATELKYMAFAAKLMTYECGIRFLEDHLNGDVYFRVRRPGQNLDRARTQFKLVADMEKKMTDMKAIIEEEIETARSAIVMERSAR